MNKLMIYAFVSMMMISVAAAAVGDEIDTVVFPEGASTGVGVAFDGEFLWYTYMTSSSLYKIRPDGTGHAVVPTTATTPFGALAWDDGRGMLWVGGTSCLPGSSSMPIWLIDPTTGVASLEFTISLPVVSGYVYCFDDGLAYDATDDTLWFSDDVSAYMGHFGVDGTPLGTVDLCAIHSDLCSNSGIAIGGDNFYLGTNGYETTMRVDRNDLSPSGIIDTFVNTDYRIEDMECDPFTFAPTEVMWIRDAYAGTTKAYEIEPATCGFAGQEPGICGDGNLDANEQCDDGNNADGDGCSANCTIEGPPGEIPEFTVIGAGLALLGAGFLVLRKKRN